MHACSWAPCRLLYFSLTVLAEIEERRQFLEEMEAMGQGKKYQTIIETEISQVSSTKCKPKT